MNVIRAILIIISFLMMSCRGELTKLKMTLWYEIDFLNEKLSRPRRDVYRESHIFRNFLAMAVLAPHWPTQPKISSEASSGKAQSHNQLSNS